MCKQLLVLQRGRSLKTLSVGFQLHRMVQKHDRNLLAQFLIIHGTYIWELTSIKPLQKLRLTIFDGHSLTGAAFPYLNDDILQRGQYHRVDFLEGMVSYGPIQSSLVVEMGPEAKPMIRLRGDCAFPDAVCDVLSAQSWHLVPPRLF